MEKQENTGSMCIVDEWGKIQKFYGKISSSCIESLVDIATSLDLPCLGGIDTENNTYFNYNQSVTILKNELPRLKTNGKISNQLFEMIQKGATFVKKEDGWTYLKIGFPPKKTVKKP